MDRRDVPISRPEDDERENLGRRASAPAAPQLVRFYGEDQQNRYDAVAERHDPHGRPAYPSNALGYDRGLQATIISPQRHAALDARRRPRKDHLLACMMVFVGLVCLGFIRGRHTQPRHHDRTTTSSLTAPNTLSSATLPSTDTPPIATAHPTDAHPPTSATTAEVVDELTTADTLPHTTSDSDGQQDGEAHDHYDMETGHAGDMGTGVWGDEMVSDEAYYISDMYYSTTNKYYEMLDDGRWAEVPTDDAFVDLPAEEAPLDVPAEEEEEVEVEAAPQSESDVGTVEVEYADLHDKAYDQWRAEQAHCETRGRMAGRPAELSDDDRRIMRLLAWTAFHISLLFGWVMYPKYDQTTGQRTEGMLFYMNDVFWWTIFIEVVVAVLWGCVIAAPFVWRAVLTLAAIICALADALFFAIITIAYVLSTHTRAVGLVLLTAFASFLKYKGYDRAVRQACHRLPRPSAVWEALRPSRLWANVKTYARAQASLLLEAADARLTAWLRRVAPYIRHAVETFVVPVIYVVYYMGVTLQPLVSIGTLLLIIWAQLAALAVWKAVLFSARYPVGLAFGVHTDAFAAMVVKCIVLTAVDVAAITCIAGTIVHSTARLLYGPDIWSSALDGTVAGIMADCDGVWYLVVAAAIMSLRTMWHVARVRFNWASSQTGTPARIMPSVCQILAVAASDQAPISDPLAKILHLLHVMGHAIIAHLTLKRWQRRQRETQLFTTVVSGGAQAIRVVLTVIMCTIVIMLDFMLARIMGIYGLRALIASIGVMLEVRGIMQSPAVLVLEGATILLVYCCITPVCVGCYERAMRSVRAEEAMPRLGVILGIEDPVGWHPRDTELANRPNNPVARSVRSIHRMLNQCWRGVSSYARRA